MTRYTGWRRLSGDTADRPDLLDFGKKLLGYLDQQRKLSGVKTCSIERTLPDGSVVRARFEYDIPVIEVRAGHGGETKPPPGAAHGFVTRPRKFGTVGDMSDGQDYYGLKAHVIVRASPTYFDASYLPDDETKVYGQVFPDGLVYFGNTDWRNGDESIAVSWHGSGERMFPGTRQRDRYVFHNGAILLNFDIVSPDEYVLGACVKDTTLYWVTAAFVSEPVDLRVWSAPIPILTDKLGGQRPTLAPRWAPITDADTVTLLQTITLPDSGVGDATFWRIGPVAFNQAATEGRAMVECFVDEDHTSLNVHELVIDLKDADKTTTTLRANVQTTDVVAQKLNAVKGNAVDWPDIVATDLAPHPNPYEVSGTDGTFTWTYTTVNHALSLWSDVGSSPYSHADIILDDGVATRTITCSASDVPIAVDYQDNVPVYAYWTPVQSTATLTRACSFNSSTTTLEATANETWSGGFIVASDSTYDHSATITADLTLTSRGSITAGSIYVVDKAGTRWYQFDYSGEIIGDTVGSVSYAEVTSDSQTVTVPDDAAHSGTYQKDNSTGLTYAATLDNSASQSLNDLAIWHMDLRQRILVVTEKVASATDAERIEDTGTASATSTSTGSINAGFSSDISGGLPLPTLTVDVDTTTSSSSNTTWTTRVLLAGNTVDTAVASASDSTSNTTTLADQTLSELGWPLRQDFVGINDDLPPFGPSLGTIYGGFRATADGITFDTEVAAIYDEQLTDPPDLHEMPMDTRGSTEHYVSYSATPLNLPVSQNPPQNWVIDCADKEGVATTQQWPDTYAGTWIVSRGRWCYSMAWLDGTDLTTPRFRSRIQTDAGHPAGVDLYPGFLPNHLDQTPDLYETMWALSDFVPLKA